MYLCDLHSPSFAFLRQRATSFEDPTLGLKCYATTVSIARKFCASRPFVIAKTDLHLFMFLDGMTGKSNVVLGQ